MVNILLSNVRVEVLALNKSQEELVNNLDMRPGNFQYRFIFLRIKSFALRVYRWWNGSKQVLAEHLNSSRIHWLCDDLSVIGDVIQEVVQCHPLDLLRFRVCTSVIEIKDDIALVDFLHEQILSSIWRYFMKSRQLFEIPLLLIRDIESRRVLSLWRSDAFYNIPGGRLEVIKHGGLRACFGWC